MNDNVQASQPPIEPSAHVESARLRLEEILDRAFESRFRNVEISGTSSAIPLAFLLAANESKSINALPHLVIVADDKKAEEFQELISFFDPLRTCIRMRGFDVSPYSGLYSQPRVMSSRLRFLHSAQNSKAGDIFVATMASLVQRTMPFKVFNSHTQTLGKGDEIPSNFAEILGSLGYRAAPIVEDVGQFAIRGGIIDVFTPSYSKPIRIELFGDQIESLRFFSADTQRGEAELNHFVLIPARETLYTDHEYENIVARVRKDLSDRKIQNTDSEQLVRSLVLKHLFDGQEFLLPYFYEKLSSPLEYFNSELNVWHVDNLEIERSHDSWIAELISDERASTGHAIHPSMELFFDSIDKLPFPDGGKKITFSSLEKADDESSTFRAQYSTRIPMDIIKLSQTEAFGTDPWIEAFKKKLSAYQDNGTRIWITHKNTSSLQKVHFGLQKLGVSYQDVGSYEYLWNSWLHADPNNIVLIPRALDESQFLSEENILILQEEDLLGKKQRKKSDSVSDFQKKAKRLNFGDLKPGDHVVHVKHGIGLYDGLHVMNIGGIETEFIQVSYKDKDKLYLPVYRVNQLQKYSGAATTIGLDKLGGVGWEKTKTKVRGHLRDLASDLLKLYAQRAELNRPAWQWDEGDLLKFEKGFPYEETDDQLRAIDDLVKDFTSLKPMDRLVCGDVGFGKTEVAMRAAFLSVATGKQVAVLAPTTVLTFQHHETFKKRFQGWPFEIRVLNRFVTTAEAKKTVQEVKDGKVQILIGTHRILSKDIAFNDLGLLIVDEEQKFGVAHKERLRKFKISVDTLSLSATPIPRTLNMSLSGIRDLSLINTAPVDRLPTRTFISKFEPETVRKAITSEIQREGQVYFINNRIESIYGLADEIRAIVPQARIRVAHGQMPEHELEKVMLEFFNHEIDVLVCTAIVESGMDVPRANTMFINEAHLFGLSQLYQLRGRVGRSKQRAYCYLILPRNKQLDKHAEERLKIIQENTALGSGIKIAQYDLELRGSGNILGEDQSGHVNSVGYELYTDLLKEALANARGETPDDIELDPEINLKIQALIPDAYIPDIRLRLSYYKALSDIENENDLELIEAELRDQFGAPPEPVLNLMGIMLIRHLCKKLKIQDISSGIKSISLRFTDKTPIKTETIIALASRENKKYSITPDNRLNIRLSNQTWNLVFEELSYLLSLVF